MLIKIVFGKQAHVMKLKEKDAYNQIRSFTRQVFKRLPNSFVMTYQDQDGDQISLMNETDFLMLKSSGLEKVKISIEEDGQQFQQLQLQEEYKLNHKVQQEQPNREESKIKQIYDKNIFKINSQLYVENGKSPQLEGVQQIIPSQPKNSVSKSCVKLQSKINDFEEIQPLKQNRFSMSSLSQIMHEDIVCDKCRQCPIVGPRYKCIVCQDYDLCSQCQQQNEHQHAFLKINYPEQEPQKIYTQLKGSKLISSKQTYLDELGAWIYNLKIDQKVASTKQKLNSVKKASFQRAKSYTEKVMSIFAKQQSKQFYVDIDNSEYKREKKPQIKQQKRVRSPQDNTIQAASYLSTVLGKDFNSCYKYAKKYEGYSYTNEEILVQYFNKPEIF